MRGHACLSPSIHLSSPQLANIRILGPRCTDTGTSLHHSTLAAESSPDSSPLALAPGGGYLIPRGGSYYLPLDSPIGHNHHYHHHHGSSHAASSLGSASMLDYVSADDSDSSSDGDLDLDFDLMDTAPASTTTATTTTTTGTVAATAAAASSATAAAAVTTAMESAASSLLNYQKARSGARYNPSRRASVRARNSPMMPLSPIFQPHSPKFGGNSGSCRTAAVVVAAGSNTLCGRTTSASAHRRSSTTPMTWLTGTGLGGRPADPVRHPLLSRRGSLLPKAKNFRRIRGDIADRTQGAARGRDHLPNPRGGLAPVAGPALGLGGDWAASEHQRGRAGRPRRLLASLASESASTSASQKGGMSMDMELARRMSFSCQAECHSGGLLFGSGGGSAD